MRIAFLATLLSLPLLSQAAPLTTPNLVVNGSFEQTGSVSVGNGAWLSFAANTNGGNQTRTLLPGWTLDSGPGIEVRNNIAGSASDGLRYVELDSYEDSSISQWIGTEAGQRYQLSFDYSPRERVAEGSNGVRVWWNEVLLAEISAEGRQSGHAWRTFEYEVMGTGNVDRLRFASFEGLNVAANTVGGSLDDVMLQRVPEPAGLALGVGALLAMGAVRRRVR
ncbi:hypothetical protein [Inhella sp.]|uniref:hypothetical protein n=1 Tax=Inhella sp. TaxID=1921806 RepID=UPI0035B32A2A